MDYAYPAPKMAELPEKINLPKNNEFDYEYLYDEIDIPIDYPELFDEVSL